jgi:nitroimidazol reductase NimA-like FMN-containing flavoprotein (pyridoxamine 5'-phosphate oxidase superfamily)
MNYTYRSSTPYHHTPSIIMTTNPSSRKTQNLRTNPNVSLLVHDWIFQRPPLLNLAQDQLQDGLGAAVKESSLAAFLRHINTATSSQISVTVNGKARFLETGTEEEKWCREQHVENHRFKEDEAENSDGGKGCFVEGEDVLVVVVDITGGRIADSKGGVKDFVVQTET